MEKIKELLGKLGGSKELVDQICEEMENWRKIEKSKLDEELKSRLVKAKQVCLEEVTNFKKEVSRKVEVFLESQVANIDRQAREKVAIEESKAANQLKQVKSLLEGIDIDGKDGNLQALDEEVKKLRESIVAIAEQRDAFEKRAERAMNIANKVLKRNQVLEGKVAKPEAKEEVKTEAKVDAKAEVKSESKVEEKKPITETKKVEKPVEQGKRVSTQRTLEENQTRATPKPVADGDASIMSIADTVEEVL